MRAVSARRRERVPLSVVLVVCAVLFAGWNYGLQVGTNLTPTYFTKFRIKTLVLTESCAHVQPGKNSISID